jgi:hypothetical protein
MVVVVGTYVDLFFMDVVPQESLAKMVAHIVLQNL